MRAKGEKGKGAKTKGQKGKRAKGKTTNYNFPLFLAAKGLQEFPPETIKFPL